MDEAELRDRHPENHDPVAMEHRFVALFEHMQEGVALHEVICDAEGRPTDYRLLDTNDQYERHTGLRRAEVRGRLASEVYGVSPAPFLEEFCSVGISGEPRRIELHFAPMDRFFSVSVAPLGGRGFATIFSDITLQKRQTEALDEIRLHQRALLDNQATLTWLKDTEGRFLVANRGLSDAFGVPSPESLIGKTDQDVLGQVVAERRRLVEQEVLSSGERRHFEEELSTTRGLLWFETTLSPVLGDDGTRLGITGVSLEITARKRAEEARLASERKFEQVFELAPDPIAVTTTESEVIYANRAFCRVIGLSSAELIGSRTLELGLWKEPGVRSQALERLARDGRFESLELVIRSRAGEERHMEMSGALTELEGRRVLITAARDVTERRLAELSARRAAESLSRYFELSIDLLCVARGDGRFVRLNPAWEAALGYRLSELEMTNFLELVHPDDRLATMAVISRLGDGQRVIDFQNRYRHADGSYRWLEWRSVPDEQGLIYAVARDVTRRREDEERLRTAERALAESHERLLGVSELAHIGHFALDRATRIFEWTPELFRIFGLTPREAAPSFEQLVPFIAPEDVAAVSTALSRAEATGQAQRVEFRAVRANGEVRSCIAIIESSKTPASVAPRIYGLVQDVTELRRAEQERVKLEQQVMQAQKLESLGVLAGGIAHDFNNLLTSILGNADLAKSELSPSSPAQSYLDDIETVSRRAADLCRQMLAYSGRGRFVIQPLSLNELVNEMAYLLTVSISKKVVIKYNFFPELPAVMADATQLRQVVMNLITNASEAIGEKSGVITLSTGVMDCDTAYLEGVVGDSATHAVGQYVYLEVSDTGCGMDPETLQKIFDPFFTTKFTGRGLGLAAVLGIVRGHHGALRVYTEKGRGTTFKVLLPAVDDRAATGERELDSRPEWTGSGAVLLVDDEESVLSMGRRLLERSGFEVLPARDGVEALEVFAAARDRIRVVVLDMTMPHMDGEACFRELRRLEPNVRVIMTSGYSEQDIVNRFIGKGLGGFVQKPYKAADLLPKIRQLLGE